eukprot:TRINITY_DN7537_c0_g1_i1.p1 TRINITY_DN7537_c0_g1~~TRINITY_DN7537_c0_g1_i1.p1  ORF type:complete len:270 (-),score=72.46 TRINITY_DN7537_c0_g1_i1:728-1537(-)
MLVVCGSFVHCTSVTDIALLENTAILVGDDGVIERIELIPKHFIGDSGYLAELFQVHRSDVHVFNASMGQFIIPGFVDTHVHAPQYVFTGTGTDLQLFEWLKRYTYPTEAKFADKSYAQLVYRKLVKSLLRNGTTTAVYFGTIHWESCVILAESCVEVGQRSLVGKVCVDQNSMDDYVESTQEAIEHTELFIKAVQKLDDGIGLVQPVITPRFVPSCSLELLRGLGKLAQEYQCFVQSHISESHDVVDYTAEKLSEFGGRDLRSLEIVG